MNKLFKLWRRVVLGERSREIRVIDKIDLQSMSAHGECAFLIKESHRETGTTTRKERRAECAS